jgi:hypothetical protein
LGKFQPWILTNRKLCINISSEIVDPEADVDELEEIRSSAQPPDEFEMRGTRSDLVVRHCKTCTTCKICLKHNKMRAADCWVEHQQSLNSMTAWIKPLSDLQMKNLEVTETLQGFEDKLMVIADLDEQNLVRASR